MEFSPCYLKKLSIITLKVSLKIVSIYHHFSGLAEFSISFEAGDESSEIGSEGVDIFHFLCGLTTLVTKEGGESISSRWRNSPAADSY